jgi:hypothetical protein
VSKRKDERARTRERELEERGGEAEKGGLYVHEDINLDVLD